MDPAHVCPACGSRKLRAVVLGAERTAEELGRAFAKYKVKTSSGERILTRVEPGAQLVLVLALPRKLGVRALLGLLVGRHGRSDVLLGSVGCRLGLLLALQEIFDGLLLTRDSISRLLLHVACLAECDLASLKLVQCLLSPGHEGIGPLNTCVHVA